MMHHRSAWRLVLHFKRDLVLVILQHSKLWRLSFGCAPHFLLIVCFKLDLLLLIVSWRAVTVNLIFAGMS